MGNKQMPTFVKSNNQVLLTLCQRRVDSAPLEMQEQYFVV